VVRTHRKDHTVNVVIIIIIITDLYHVSTCTACARALFFHLPHKYVISVSAMDSDRVSIMMSRKSPFDEFLYQKKKIIHFYSLFVHVSIVFASCTFRSGIIFVNVSGEMFFCFAYTSRFVTNAYRRIQFICRVYIYILFIVQLATHGVI